MSDIKRADLKKGDQVRIALKKDQRTNKLTEGVVREILTKSASHPHGIKVRLENGQVGRVKELLKNW
ncbi:MAG: YwbE family protein [Anaerolineales bacterium]|nr:YwbE family protein [Anaerolineales bacterium]